MKMKAFDCFMVIMYLANFIIGLFGNTLVLMYLLVALKGSKKFIKSLAYILINLALADICTEIFGIVGIIFEYDLVKHPTKEAGKIICKLFTMHTLTWSFTNVSVLTVLLLAWERYRAVTQLKSTNTLNDDKSKCIAFVLGLFWILGPAAYSPYIPFQHFDELNGCAENFPSNWSKYTIVLCDYILFFFLPLLFFAFAYTSIVMALKKPQKNMSSRRKQQFSYHKVRRKLTNTTMLIVCGFVFCWGAAYTIYTIQVLGSIDNEAMNVSYQVSLLLAYFASTSHPIIYSFRSRHFRRTIKSFLQDLKVARVLIHMFSSHPTKQIEPSKRPNVIASNDSSVGIRNQAIDDQSNSTINN